MSMFLNKIREKWVTLVILGITALGIWFRVSFYGDLRLSIGMNDTESYISSSTAPLFSWKLFAGQRLLTTNLLYKLANNPRDCTLTDISLPTKGAVREIQPCFDKIVLLQNIISIIAWCLLAWTTSRWLKNPLTKIISVVLVLAFAFTPQIAEWDSVLSSESLSVSLLVLTIAILQEIVFRVSYRNRPLNSVWNIALISGWLLIFTFWIFLRDANLYVLLSTIILLSAILLFKKYRRMIILPLIIILLLGIFVLGYISARDSLRATHYPLQHSFQAYIFPYPLRMEFFSGFGMPDPKSPAFQKWFDAQATKTYALFLITHPRFIVTTMFNQLYYFTFNSTQPYYVTDSLTVRRASDKIGEFFHPESSSVYLLDALMLMTLVAATIRYHESWLVSWTWLALWLFMCAAITLFTNFFGDTIGAARHVVPPEETFRLSLWIFLVIHMDYLLQQQEARSTNVL